MHSLDTVLEKIVFELDSIASVTRGKRVSTVDGLCLGVLDDTYLNSIYRSFYRDSRNRLIPYIEQKIQTAAAFAERLLESKYLSVYESTVAPSEEAANMFNKRLEQANKLLQSIHAVPKGLKCLAETYIDDKNAVYQLQQLSNTINNSIVPPLFLQLKALREARTKFVIEREMASRRGAKASTSAPTRSSPLPIPAAARSHEPNDMSPGETF